jgi:hypothetical protein
MASPVARGWAISMSSTAPVSYYDIHTLFKEESIAYNMF